ncbi:MAG: DUF2179 domain-containing protein [Spirochaetes bacterium]|nr:DUF2179 domain-containing protein [Spirochaetota bacterium]
MINFFNSYNIINLVLVPSIIFIAKVTEVSLATVALIFTSKGYKKLATIISFLEIFIYLFAISRLIDNMTNIFYYFSYAGGYALGTYIGIWIEEKISIGYTNIRIITKKNADKLEQKLHFEGYKTTKYTAESVSSLKVNVVNAIVKRKEINKIIQIINDFDKKIFYSVEDIRYVSG